MTSALPPNLSCLTRIVQETQLLGLEVHFGASCALSSLKLKLCWDNVSEFQYQHPHPLEAVTLWLVAFVDRASLLHTDPKGDKGQHQHLPPTSLLLWLFLPPVLALGRTAPTPAKEHCSVSWGTSSAKPSTSDMLRVLSTTSLSLLCDPWQGCDLLIKHSHNTQSCARFFLQAGKLMHGAGAGQGLH